MLICKSNSWGVIITNFADGTQPTTAPGTAITPGNNSFPAYAEILGDTSDETFYMEIIFTNGSTSTASRDILVNLGFDFAGGTTYTDLTISHLLASSASAMGVANGPGVSYEFPVRLPAGTAVAASASVNNGTVGTVSVQIKLYGKPSRPDLIRYGSFVRTYGAVTAASKGTTITPGTVADGAYVAMGTTTDDIWAWEFGVGLDTGTMSARNYAFDLAVGDATNKKIVIQDAVVNVSSAESIFKAAALMHSESKSGDVVYIRAQSSGSLAGVYSAIAYGVGG